MAEVQTLKPLTSAEFKTYNALATKMDYFHNHFRSQWQTLHNAASMGALPSHTKLRAFLNLGLSFCSSLTTHHTIEERHVFPVLGRKMAVFRHASEVPSKKSGDAVTEDEEKAGELLAQHELIHEGLVKFEKFLEQWKDEEGDEDERAKWRQMKDVMDSFGGVLWQHLDEEVRMLGAENMRKYWTVDEIRRMPF